ncbi:MAG: PadR family transcriptional regulator [Actinomycetota bacterium]
MCEREMDVVSCCCEGGSDEDKEMVYRASCHCGGHIPKPFVLPAILLLLDEEPSHGYSLLRTLHELEMSNGDMSPATVYRILSRLEEKGLAVHDHVDEGQGPTRKVYMLTDEGRAALAEWGKQIEKTRDLLEWFARRYSNK